MPFQSKPLFFSFTVRYHRVLVIALAAACLLSAALGASQPADNGETRTLLPASAAQAWAQRVDHAPRVDGTLNDSIWAEAKPISDFLEREPAEGQPASEHTSVRVLYTQHEVFFGIECRDSHASQIVANELRRDVTQSLDDSFEIVIDSARNGRNAYVFQINPLGTQRDALIADEAVFGDGTDDGDSGWDGVWKSESRITASGWTATVAIPFDTLNFMQSRDVVWGINFRRFIRSRNEEDLWSSWRRVDGAHRISQAGELHGISGIGNSRLFIVKPYVLTGFDHYPAAVAGTGLDPGTSGLGTGGIDVKIGLRSNLVANLTANTDFADADVDAQQFNITPYKIFFPEKRQFFLENAGVFNFSLGDDSSDLLFFSRQIGIDPVTGQEVPVNGGGRITGSIGRFEVGAMDVSTRGQGPNPWQNFAVTRVKRSLWGGSYLGAMGIDKRSGKQSDSFNQSAGADARMVFLKHLVVDGFVAQTRTYRTRSSQSSEGAGFQFMSNVVDFRGHRRKIEPNFNPESGFLSRANCICDYLDLTLKERPRSETLRQIDFEHWIFNGADTKYHLETLEWESDLRFWFQNGAVSDNLLAHGMAQRLRAPFTVYKNVAIPAGEYRWMQHQLNYASAPNRRWTMSGTEVFGGYYNGRLNQAKVTSTYRPNARMSFQFAEQWNRFRLPVTGGNFSVVYGSLQSNYSLSRFLMLSSLVQMNTANTQGASANLRLRWNYRPDSDLYVIYTSGQRYASLTDANAPQFSENRLAIKLTYSWRP